MTGHAPVERVSEAASPDVPIYGRSTGSTSALQLLTDQTVSGVAAAFDTFVTAMSIAHGLMVATVVMPGRFGYVSPRGAGG